MIILNHIGKQFKQPSGFLGKIISFLMKNGNSKAYSKIIGMLQIKPGDKLFEIGYGHGLGITRIMAEFNCAISGIDFSELMFQEASKRNKKYIDNKQVKLHFGNFLNIKPHLEHYDKIYCINVVYFWDELEIPFSLIKSMLKPTGIFCFYMEHPETLNKFKFTSDDIFNKYTIEKVLEKLKYVGFSHISYELNKGYYISARF